MWHTLKNYVTEFVQGKEVDGGGFASWVAEGSADVLKDARALGSERLLAIVKTAPEWPTMQPYEAKLIEFIDQVISWQPEAAEPDDEEEITDLTGGSPATM